MNTDIQNYMGALSQVNLSKQLINERLQTQLQKNEAIMPISELALGESGKMILEKGVEMIKDAGTNAIKNFARGKMQDAGIDNETIDNVLSGDLLNVSKVSSLINIGKQKALDVAKSKMEDAGVDDDTINSILKGDFSGAFQGKVDEAINTAKSLKSQVTDTIDNIGSDLKQSIATSEGIADDLKAQAMQEYNSFRIDTGELPTLTENEGFLSGIGNRFMNSITQQIAPQPQDVELVDMASLPPKAPIVTTASEGAIDTGADIAGGIAELGADIGIGDVLGPLGVIGGLIGGIVGIVKGEEKPDVPQGILNPSEQFL